jgi:muramoyltetrapeptide carboxypeptidase
MTIPSYLQPGDLIGIVCPSGQLGKDKAQTCIQTLEDWGYKVRVGKTLGHSFHYFSGTDSARLEDLQQMLDDPEIKAILCGRGGYGMSRIIDRLDFRKFCASPKWVIGFSDITLLHAHLCQVCQVASIHGPMAGAFNGEGAVGPYVASLHSALAGDKALYVTPSHPLNRAGSAQGVLVGGNLALLAHSIGSISAFHTEGAILFLEDIGEYLYNIDRMMLQLDRSGWLNQLSGLIIGGFTDLKDTVIPFGQTVDELILDKVGDYGYPVSFGFPVVHGGENLALKIGAHYRLEVTRGGSRLIEL